MLLEDDRVRGEQPDRADTTAKGKDSATSASSEPMKAPWFSAGWSLKRLHGSPLAPRELCLSLELSSTRLTDGNSTAIQCRLDPVRGHGSALTTAENNTLKGSGLSSFRIFTRPRRTRGKNENERRITR